MPGSIPASLIVGIGEVLWDVYPDDRFLGGAPANVIWNAAGLNKPAVMVSRVGQDEWGVAALQSMAARGISTDYIQRDPDIPTGQVHVTLDARGVPSFKCDRNAAYHNLQPEESWNDLIPRVGAVVFGTTGQLESQGRESTQYFIRRVLTGLKVFDINIRGRARTSLQIAEDSMHMADIVKVNDEELCVLREEFTANSVNDVEAAQQVIQRYNLAALLITFGPQGAAVVTPETILYTPGYAIEPVDTTGAGDAFTTGYVVKTLEQQSLSQCLGYANAMAAFHATLRGGTPDFSAGHVAEFQHKSNERITNPAWMPWLVEDC
jgi:fructokinase